MTSFLCVLIGGFFLYFVRRDSKLIEAETKKMGVCFKSCSPSDLNWKHGLLFFILLGSLLIPNILKMYGFSKGLVSEIRLIVSVLIVVISLYAYFMYLRLQVGVNVLKEFVGQKYDLDKAIDVANRACLDGNLFKIVFAKLNTESLETNEKVKIK